MKKIALIICAFILSITLFSQEEQTRKEKKQEKRTIAFEELSKLIESGEFNFIAQRALPQGYQPVDLTTHNADLEIKNDSALAYLPYFGRAFSPTYGGGDNGIKFEESVKDYSVEYDDEKRRIIIKFDIKSPNDSYSCTLTITTIDSASLYVNSNKRAPMNYSGRIESVDKEE